MSSTGPSPVVRFNLHSRPVTPKRRSARKRDRAAKQEALVRAATKLFADKGYDLTTTREIAALAGCAEGLIHRYFQGKAGLLVAMMSYHASRDIAELNDGLPLAGSLEAEIDQLMSWEVARIWKDRDLLRACIPHALLDPKVGRFVNRVGPQRHAKAIRERLRQYKNDEVSDDEIDAIAQAIGALGFAFGFMHPVLLGSDGKQTPKLTSRLAKIFAQGLQCG